VRLEDGGIAVVVVAGDDAAAVDGARLEDEAPARITNRQVEPDAPRRVAGGQLVPGWR
jgi:hypothetical protein